MSITQKGYTANLEGLSTDTKPTDVELNTIFHALDTDKHYYFDGTDWNEMQNSGGGGSGFTPTTEQLAAMNSGATTEKINQIETNKNNISLLKHADNTSIIVQENRPTRSGLVQGSYWLSTSGIKILRVSDNKFDTTGAETGYIDGTGSMVSDADFMTTDYIDVSPSVYTISTTSDMTGKVAFRIAQYDSNGVFLNRILTPSGEQSYQYEIGSSVAKIRISYYANADGLSMTDVNWY